MNIFQITIRAQSQANDYPVTNMEDPVLRDRVQYRPPIRIALYIESFLQSQGRFQALWRRYLIQLIEILPVYCAPCRRAAAASGRHGYFNVPHRSIDKRGIENFLVITGPGLAAHLYHLITQLDLYL